MPPDEAIQILSNVYLVVREQGGLFGAYLDPAAAHASAQETGSVVVTLPVSADYRLKIKRVSSRNADQLRSE